MGNQKWSGRRQITHYSGGLSSWAVGLVPLSLPLDRRRPWCLLCALCCPSSIGLSTSVGSHRPDNRTQTPCSKRGKVKAGLNDTSPVRKMFVFIWTLMIFFFRNEYKYFEMRYFLKQLSKAWFYSLKKVPKFIYDVTRHKFISVHIYFKTMLLTIVLKKMCHSKALVFPSSSDIAMFRRFPDIAIKTAKNTGAGHLQKESTTLVMLAKRLLWIKIYIKQPA